MARLVGLKDQYRRGLRQRSGLDRHGIVTPSAGLMNPNHYLAVAIRYLLAHRPAWPASAAVGKTLVSSSMIDRVVQKLGRRLVEVPVGFKWFVPGLFDGSYLLRRRRKRRGELPAARRHRLDDRQRRPDHGPAGRRNHRPHGQGPGRALPRTDGGVRHAVLHAHRRAGDARAEGEAAEAVARGRQGVETWRASRSPPS